jgi:hypothetical protein
MFVLEEKKATSWKPIDLRTMKYRKLEKKIVTFYDKAP